MLLARAVRTLTRSNLNTISISVKISSRWRQFSRKKNKKNTLPLQKRARRDDAIKRPSAKPMSVQYRSVSQLRFQFCKKIQPKPKKHFPQQSAIIKETSVEVTGHLELQKKVHCDTRKFLYWQNFPRGFLTGLGRRHLCFEYLVIHDIYVQTSNGRKQGRKQHRNMTRQGQHANVCRLVC